MDMVTMDPFDVGQLWQPFRADSMRFQEVFPHGGDYARLVRETETLACLIRSYSAYSMTCAALALFGCFPLEDLTHDGMWGFHLEWWKKGMMTANPDDLRPGRARGPREIWLRPWRGRAATRLRRFIGWGGAGAAGGGPLGRPGPTTGSGPNQ